MNVAVIGGGIVGTLTAYYLWNQGCQVTIFDRAAEPASATSRANGGQLSYSFCDAMADPQLIPKLPGILLGFDPAFSIRPSLQPDFIRWGLKFLAECRSRQRDDNTRALLTLAQRSAELMETLKQQFGEHADFTQHGKVVLLGHEVDQETLRRIEIKRNLGLELAVLNEQEIIAVEPALADLAEPPVAGIYSPNDAAANAHIFAVCLSQYLVKKGVVTRYGESVDRLVPVDKGRCRIVTGADDKAYSAVVLATGDGATKLLRPHGIKLPVLGMSGYSWTFPATEASPSTSITALSKRLVFSRLGNVVRVAGFADVNPHPARHGTRADTLRNIAAQLLPKGADYENPTENWWHGVRAMTPDSRPILGATALPGVYTNLGHGMLGWTLGAATSEYVAREITKNGG